jgi:hypothetical protein
VNRNKKVHSLVEEIERVFKIKVTERATAIIFMGNSIDNSKRGDILQFLRSDNIQMEHYEGILENKREKMYVYGSDFTVWLVNLH